MKFGSIVVYTNLYSKCDFYENWLIDIHILLKRCINFCLYFPHFLTDLGEIKHRISLIVELRYCGLYECR